MRLRNLLIAAVAASLHTTVVLACGPDFPWQLLDDRARTLRATPANSFAYEAAHLVPQPADALTAVEDSWDGAPQQQVEGVERISLSEDQAAAVQQMRAAEDGEDAYRRGAGVPAAIRLYTAGAVDFRHGNLTRAAGRFESVLQLPDNDRRERVIWAAYMLGRVARLESDFERMTAAFRLTRQLANNGAPDPMGLAVATLGEEAAPHLDRANAQLIGDELPPDAAPTYAREIGAAVRLYAEQAAHGSRSGRNSLRMVAEQLIKHPDLAIAGVADPLAQRLLVVYVLARFGDTTQRSSYYSWDVQDSDFSSAYPMLVTLVAAIERHGIDHPPAADRLAALAYRIGRYDLAATLVQRATGPLAAWVGAKLALQKGDLSAAAGYYAAASKAFPTAQGELRLEDANVGLLAGEGAVLALARGEYVDTLSRLYAVAASYWGDVAHVAERVLTVDELRDFVERHVPAPPKPELKADEWGRRWEKLPWGGNPAAQIRDLLARRLVRAGRYQEALAYFYDPEVAPKVAEYAQALQDAEHRWKRIHRAEAWFSAAKLARWSGMEMMGYETAPDYFALEGAYDWGLGQVSLRAAFVTPGERKRFAASGPDPDLRFRYRYVAVAQAVRAADLLPRARRRLPQCCVMPPVGC